MDKGIYWVQRWLGSTVAVFRRCLMGLTIAMLSVAAHGQVDPVVFTVNTELTPLTGQWVTGRDVIVRQGTLTVTGSHHWRSLVIESGARVTHAPGDPSGLRLIIQSDLLIAQNGLLDVTASGNPGGQGAGAGQTAEFYDGRGGGGGYGGAGGDGLGARGGKPFGDPLSPDQLGSGGGAGGPWPGSAGGGSLRLDVGGVLTVDGLICADGEDASFAGGAGSGGSVWAVCGVLSGSGIITARGGNTAWAGGGGGGRIRVETALDRFEGWLDLTGGLGYLSSNGQKGTRITGWLPGRAAILRGVTGEVTNGVPPNSLLANVDPLAVARAFPEARDVTVDGVIVDVRWPVIGQPITLPGSGAVSLNSVHRLSSTLVHFDPPTAGLNVTGTVHFDDPVVALVTASGTLDQTDARLARMPIEYPNQVAGRGLEAGDSVHLVDRYTVAFQLTAGNDLDEFRVITATPNVVGVVELLDHLGNPDGRPVHINAPGHESMVTTLDNAGRYWTFIADAPDLAVTVRVPGWLGQRTMNRPHGEGLRGCALATLVNGDIDGDNAVTVFDFDRLSQAFDTTSGDAAWDASADLDGDGLVTVFDYDILSRNFDLVGED